MTVDVIDGREYPEIAFNQLAPFQCITVSVPITADVANIAENRLDYQWSVFDGGMIEGSDTSHEIMASGLGSYQVAVFDSVTSCISIDTFVLEREQQSFQSLEVEITDPACEDYNNGMIEILSFDGDYPPYHTTINGYDYGTQTIINYLSPGEYIFEVVDAIGCELNDTIIVEEPIDPFIQLPNDTTVYLGDTLSFNAIINRDLSEIDSIMWIGASESDGLYQSFLVTENGQVTLVIVDENGCEAEASFYINIIEPEQNILPNVFAPNSSRNAVFYVPNNPSFEEVLTFDIYDNWGGLVYRGESIEIGNPTIGWDGTLNGKRVEYGVYVYRLIAKLKTGQEKEYYGTVTLIR